MSDLKIPVSMGHTMRVLTEQLFELPEDMRVRVLDSLRELVGPSRAELHAEEIAAEEKRDLEDREFERQRLSMLAVLIQPFVEAIRSVAMPSPHYPPPPEPVVTPAPSFEHIPKISEEARGAFAAAYGALSADQRNALMLTVSAQQLELLRALGITG